MSDYAKSVAAYEAQRAVESAQEAHAVGHAPQPLYEADVVGDAKVQAEVATEGEVADDLSTPVVAVEEGAVASSPLKDEQERERRTDNSAPAVEANPDQNPLEAA